MDAELRAALVGVAGERAVSADAVGPRTADEVAGALRACAALGARAALSSGPTPRVAVLPAGASVLLCVGGMDEVSVDAAAGVVRVGAGATIQALRAACDGAGLVLAAPLATRSPAPSHVGSLVARGGLARRAVCGVEAVLGTGDIVRAGGAVQRDVTGFDLVAILLGSGGRLGVVTMVWLRVQPASVPSGPHDAQGTVDPGLLGEALRAAFDPARVLVGA